MLADMYKIYKHCHHEDHHKSLYPIAGNDTRVDHQKSGTRRIKVVRKVLDVNDAVAMENRTLFNQKGVFVLNVMSSPGSGKTTILEKTLLHMTSEIKSAVIVGDICTSNDADRLSGYGAPVVQVNTDAFGGDCHLAAHVIKTTLNNFDLDNIDLLIVENLGNLVCPAEFDIGEDLRVVVLSVTEGEDKPLKYPLMFRVCHAALINKIDLLSYLDYNITETVKNIRNVNGDIPIFQISAKTEAGFEPWIKWLKEKTYGKIKRDSIDH